MKIIGFISVLLLFVMVACYKTHKPNTLELLINESFVFSVIETTFDDNLFDGSDIYTIQFNQAELEKLKRLLNDKGFELSDPNDTEYFIKRISERFGIKSSNLENFELYRGDFKEAHSCSSGCSVYFLISTDKAYIEIMST